MPRVTKSSKKRLQKLQEKNKILLKECEKERREKQAYLDLINTTTHRNIVLNKEKEEIIKENMYQKNLIRNQNEMIDYLKVHLDYSQGLQRVIEGMEFKIPKAETESDVKGRFEELN